MARQAQTQMGQLTQNDSYGNTGMQQNMQQQTNAQDEKTEAKRRKAEEKSRVQRHKMEQKHMKKIRKEEEKASKKSLKGRKGGKHDNSGEEPQNLLSSDTWQSGENESWEGETGHGYLEPGQTPYDTGHGHLGQEQTPYEY